MQPSSDQPAPPLVAFVDSCRHLRSGWLEIREESGLRHRLGFWRGRLVRLDVAAAIAPLTQVLSTWDDVDHDLVEVLAASNLPDEELARELLAARATSQARMAEAQRVQVLRRLAYLFGLRAACAVLRETDDDALADARPLVFVPHAYLHFARDPAARVTVGDYVARFGDKSVGLALDLDLHGLGFDGEEAAVARRLSLAPCTIEELAVEGFDRDVVAGVLFTLALSEGIRILRVRSSVRRKMKSKSPAPSAPPHSGRPSRPARISRPAKAERQPDPIAAAEEAERLVAAGRHAEATTVVRRALVHCPEHPSLQAMSAHLDATLAWTIKPFADEQRATVQALDAIVEREPTCALALHYRGLIHRRLGDHERALQDQRAALKINPFHPDTMRELSELSESPAPEGPTAAPRWYQRLLRRA